LAKPLGYAPDGFSKPYQAAIQFGALAVAFLGLWLLRRLLLYYFKDGVVAICLFVLVVGTNYLNYSAIDGSISHSWYVHLYVALMLCSRSFHLKPTTTLAAGYWRSLRPGYAHPAYGDHRLHHSLLWGVEDIRIGTIRGRISFLWAQRGRLLLAALIAGCIISIQLIYWKSVSGHWLVYSYQDQGFSWLHPHIFDYAFSYRSGWLIYTPAMLLAIIGFIPLIFRGPQRVMIIVFCGIAFYIVSAWDVWWYAGMGGGRWCSTIRRCFFRLRPFLSGSPNVGRVRFWPHLLCFC
jgi:hypothetical protein